MGAGGGDDYGIPIHPADEMWARILEAATDPRSLARVKFGGNAEWEVIPGPQLRKAVEVLTIGSIEKTRGPIGNYLVRGREAVGGSAVGARMPTIHVDAVWADSESPWLAASTRRPATPLGRFLERHAPPTIADWADRLGLTPMEITIGPEDVGSRWQAAVEHPPEKEEEPMSTKQCDLPPEGWRCTRDAGHEGPCAAVQVGSPAATEAARRYTGPTVDGAREIPHTEAQAARARRGVRMGESGGAIDHPRAIGALRRILSLLLTTNQFTATFDRSDASSGRKGSMRVSQLVGHEPPIVNIGDVLCSWEDTEAIRLLLERFEARGIEGLRDDLEETRHALLEEALQRFAQIRQIVSEAEDHALNDEDGHRVLERIEEATWLGGVEVTDAAAARVENIALRAEVERLRRELEGARS